MDDSLKAGIISGLIAGFVLGIITEFSNQTAVSLGFYAPWFRPIVTNNIAVNIPLFGFWGIVLGIIYSRVYSVIPRKGVLRGLIYGTFLYVIISIRIEMFDLAYGRNLMVAGGIFANFFNWISFGLVLGVLYEFLSGRYYPTKEKKKIYQYDMKSGILPGAIAGIFGGLAASVFAVIGTVTGYWGIPLLSGQIISTIDYWQSQAGTHVFINMFWGTIYGIIFPKVYDLVPGKGIKKGFLYGMILYLVTSFLIGVNGTIWSAFHYDWFMARAYAGNMFVIGSAQAVAFSLVFGLLYRKPSK
jgi:hypothetical protein